MRRGPLRGGGIAPGPLLLLLSLVLGWSHGCLQDPASAYRFTGAVCRLTYPAAAVLNEKTTKVIEAAFQHARYPSLKGEKSLLFGSKLVYQLDNLEIHNLSIGRSTLELLPGEGIAMETSNVSAVFQGTIKYGYGSWLVNIGHSVDFEIQSQIDLGINPKLYCGGGKVAADTSDCYLNFHKLHLLLQGDREPNWLKKLFTKFITLTVKLAIKGQICKEINKVANTLADFIQERAAHFLTDGDISVDIGITAPPVITQNYIESYHKGLTNYKNTSAVITQSVFQPQQLTEDKMLYLWLSDEMFNPIVIAAHQDGRFQLNVSGAELTELFKTKFSNTIPESIQKCLLDSGSTQLSVWSSSTPSLNTSTLGTAVQAQASGRLSCGTPATPTLLFQINLTAVVTASYAHKKVTLHSNATEVFSVAIGGEAVQHHEPPSPEHDALVAFITEAVEKIGIPKVLSVLATEVTRLLDNQGTHLFDIYNPEVLPRDGYVVIQMDFGFPHHLLVEFLQRTLQ